MSKCRAFQSGFMASRLLVLNKQKRKLAGAACAAIMGVLPLTAVQAHAETRTLSMYFGHTKESITITYKKNGRYIPSAMRKINYFLRDWRRNVVTRMDPKTIDLLWELHADLGSKKPVFIISGYRSAKTNAMLSRIGRHVARKSMHIRGKAIDVVFPDVPLAKLRGSALVRKVGGVGYYPRSGKYGFVHIDSGNVRHWPRMSSRKFTRLMKKYRYTVNARFKRSGYTQYAAAQANKAARQQKAAKVKTNVNIKVAAATVPVKPVAKPVKLAQAQTVNAVPLPRPRPYEVLVVAAANLHIEPASAPIHKHNFSAQPSVVQDDLSSASGEPYVLTEDAPLPTTKAPVVASVDATQTVAVTTSNSPAKNSFVTDLRGGTAKDVPLIHPMQANLDSGGLENMFWWSSSSDQMIRRDGEPRKFSQVNDNSIQEITAADAAPISAEDQAKLDDIIAEKTGEAIKLVPTTATVQSGKADMLQVNRNGKGDFNPTSGKLSQLEAKNKKTSERSAKIAAAVLDNAVKPLSFE